MTQRKHPRKWSAQVMHKSNTLNLERMYLKRMICMRPLYPGKGLRSAITGVRGTPYQPAMSTLNFYIGR